MTRGLRDSLAIAGLVAFTIFYVTRHGRFHDLPMEDALMLLRYSRNMAAGHGIRWNVGERPVEGATDFLFMVTVGLLSRAIRQSPILIDRLLLVITHVGSVVLVYYGSRKLFRWPIWTSCCLALYLATGLATAYISTGFGAPFFAFFALASWYLVLQCMQSGRVTYSKGVVLGILLLLTSLTRPEGVLMSIFILCAFLLGLGRASLPTLVPAASAFSALGSIYFIWRWQYFGYLLPNPFYLKGGGHLYAGSLIFSASAILLMLAPLMVIYLASLLFDWRRTLIGVLPTLGFTVIWVLLSNENNHFMRFQYCAFPLTVLSLPFVSRGLVRHFRGVKVGILAQIVAVCAVAFLSSKYWSHFTDMPAPDEGLYRIARALLPFKNKGYTLAVTEAGILPYYSEWRSVDLYGLNDPQIIHHGLSDSYLRAEDPAIIMYHQPPVDQMGPAFANTVRRTEEFATSGAYRLAAVWSASQCDRQIWFVRKDVPEADQFERIIRRAPYFVEGVSMIYSESMPEACSK